MDDRVVLLGFIEASNEATCPFRRLNKSTVEAQIKWG